MKKLGIIDYDQGNIKSLKNAINRVGFECNLLNSNENLNDYDTLFLPGVGAFSGAMHNLNSKGLVKPIKEYVNSGRKLVGICLGMQLLFEKSFEFGEFDGLALIEGEVLPFENEVELKIPNVGWNYVINKQNYSILESDYYFVHSYYCKPKNNDDVLFTSIYGIEFCSAVKKNNIVGFQFHPEKSQKKGLELLKTILNE